MSKKVGYAIIISFVLLVAAVAIYGLGWYIPSINPIPPSPPGPKPEVVYKTDVKVSNYWFDFPKIQEVKSTLISTGALTTSVGQPEITFFPFNGKLVVEVVYPNGARIVVGEQKISLDRGADTIVTFMWKTKYSGKHIVIATLYDDSGNLVDQKTEDVYAPER